MFVVSVSAEDSNNAEFCVSLSGNIAVGEEINVLVGIKNAYSLKDINVGCSYDAECMEFVKIKAVESDKFMPMILENVSGTSINDIGFYDEFSGDIDFFIITLRILDTKNTEFTVTTRQCWPDDSIVPSTSVFDLSELVSTGEFIDTSYKYKIENGEVIITDCDLDISGNVIIPDTIDGYPVTVIGDHAFSGCDKMTSVVVPDSVKTIEQFAFSGSDGLLSATIGSGVTTLGQNIFWSCQNLENVVIEEGVPYISQEMFSQCGKLNTVSIPESVTDIGEKAFQFCYLLEGIKLPSKLTKIASCTFYSCINLKSIVIPDSVTEICDNAFYGCEDLAAVKLPKNLTEIEYDSFADSGLTSIDFPDSVASIGRRAFAGTKIKSVVIPCSVTVICDSAFRNCKNLSEVTIPKTVKIIEPYAFCGCDRLQEVIVPANVTEIWGVAFGYEAGFTPKGITVYGVKGSAAQTYTENNWYAIFVELKESDFNFDVNGDGDITAADARLALRASATLEKLSGLAALAADVDANGSITAADARNILRKSAELE
ncbi:MAG: leucine-rich repeat domain-containing protein [Clostridia bacterium]|nr:leucine-rich repeat domain-containing protein [Clostridia bacterium]